MTTPEESFGSGLGLKRDFDFAISETGSLDTVEGSTQLEKKLAYATAKRVIPEIGKIQGPSALEDVRLRVRRIALEDPRVDEVLEFNVQQNQTDSDQVDVELKVRSPSDEVHDLSFSA